ncbi:glucans biosynthesis glucosyltransferase MdoH [Acidisoma cladoniae]|uniref:glucans biosynthesis glucosyltransferase MdoH n=1 Tax=Acidisoma cladoniae TaxID=3040935 RepID=UPI00254FD27D|nr:glucans biosynthesis glucosyltransferase MdoH [Acidisoma sp. PAMC 29798]
MSIEEKKLRGRRAVVLALNLVSWVGFGLIMARIIGGRGWSWEGAVILALFLIGLPWTLLAFWNSLIGFVILRSTQDAAVYTNPALQATPADAPITLRTAICIAIRHENVARVANNLAAMRHSLGAQDKFEFHVLSDSSRPDMCAAEAAAFGGDPDLHYRRRAINTGYKAGNLRDFALAHQGRIDCMLALDADSLMSGAAILRLARVMQANPRLGILQTLVVGRPAASPFARIFQFGMRHGMRTHTVGIAWWQGPSGPYWGHNAIIRLRPFVDHCALPVLSDRLPLGGHVLSHDQVEAALMRAGGFDARVIADEFGSWEENPPRLPDFIRRDLRWCQGNLQYLRLIGGLKLRPMGRFQLVNAIAMYAGAPTSIVMLTVGLLNGLHGARGHIPESLAFGLYFGMLALGFAPRLLGVCDVLLRPAERRRWGGAARLLAGAVADGLFTLMIGPVMMVAQTRFIVGLVFGQRIIWEAQQRDDDIVPLAEAVRGLWPQLLLGLCFAAGLWKLAPGALPWALPTLAGSLLAIPFACVTAMPRLGRWMQRTGLCAVPGGDDIG